MKPFRHKNDYFDRADFARYREHLLRWIAVADLRGLEIGPLDKPLVPRDGNRISYLDEFPLDVLVERCRSNPNRDEERVVPLDFTLDGRKISDAVDRTFDFVVASHVIEHVPNLFGWLRDIAKILEPNGRLFLVVPDRRFTFDAKRPLTSLGELIENDRQDLQKPPFRSVFDQRFYHRPISAAEAWAARERGRELDLEPSFEVRTAHSYAEGTEANYLDVHCSVFEPQSFRTSIDASCQLGIQPFECLELAPTTRPFLDFIALLGCSNDRSALQEYSPASSRADAAVTTALPPEILRDTSAMDAQVDLVRSKAQDSIELPPKRWIRQSGPFPSVQHFFDSSFKNFKELLCFTGLSPTHHVMDYGCGLGRLAIPLSAFLDPRKGRYCGIDTDQSCISRNREVFAEYGNFSFEHVDIYNKMYNRKGGNIMRLSEHKFGGTFDLVFLFSVFTHILPEDCDFLLQFLRSQLRDSGELLSTWFLLNGETRKAIDLGLAHRKFAASYRGARIDDPQVPEGAVAYEEEDVLERFGRAGFPDVRVHYGKWRGNIESWIWQDIVIARP